MEQNYNQHSEIKAFQQADTRITPQLIGDILNIVHNAVFLVDNEDTIVFINTRMAQMFGITKEKLLGLHVKELFMPSDRQLMVRNILAITRRDGELETEAMLLRPDNTSFLGLLACSLFKWEHDQGIAVTIHDISKMKTLKQMLYQSERVAFLGRMLDDISHQIRNPVSVIGGLAKRIQSGISNPQYAEAIIKEAVRLEDLLDTLTRFTKLPRPRQESISLESLFNRIEPLAKGLTGAKGIECQCSCPSELRGQHVFVDADLLLQALDAVLVNACEAYDAGRQDKSVSVEIIDTGEKEHPYAIRVSDHGSGIGNDDLPHIFAHFFTKKTRHIGMGLTFAQRIIDEQKGVLTISTGTVPGTTVIIKLVGERRRDIRTKMLVE